LDFLPENPVIKYAVNAPNTVIGSQAIQAVKGIVLPQKGGQD